MPVLGPDRLHHPDLLDPLQDGREHRVRDPQAGHPRASRATKSIVNPMSRVFFRACWRYRPTAKKLYPSALSRSHTGFRLSSASTVMVTRSNPCCPRYGSRADSGSARSRGRIHVPGRAPVEQVHKADSAFRSGARNTPTRVNSVETRGYFLSVSGRSASSAAGPASGPPGRRPTGPASPPPWGSNSSARARARNSLLGQPGGVGVEDGQQALRPEASVPGNSTRIGCPRAARDLRRTGRPTGRAGTRGRSARRPRRPGAGRTRSPPELLRVPVEPGQSPATTWPANAAGPVSVSPGRRR